MSDCKFLTLENGLTVLIYSDKSKNTNHAQFVNFFGGCTHDYVNNNGETLDIIPGTAHLLEHYVCENSKYGNLIDSFRGMHVLDSNALTNNNVTSFYFTTVDNYKECIKILIDGVYNPIFSNERLEKTKYAVYNEIRDAEDSKNYYIFKNKMKSIFSFYNTALGDSFSIDKIDSKYLEEVYKYFYVPKNQFLILAGNFDEDDIINYVKNILKNYSFSNSEKRKKYIDKMTVNNKETYIEGESLDDIIISFKIPTYNLNNFERYKLDWYLNYYIDNVFSYYSITNEELKYKNIITGDLSSGMYRLNGYTVIEVSAYTNNRKEFIDYIMKSLNNLSKEKFELSKKSSKTDISVRKDKISNYIMPIMDNYIEFDYAYDDTIDFIDSLSYEEYVKFIKNIDFNNYSVLTVRGKEK